MKKRIFALVLVCVLVLAGCGGGEEPYDVEDTAKALLEAEGVFSEELIPLEQTVFVPFLGIDDEKLTAGEVYVSSGSTAEELAVLEFADEDAAAGAAAQMEEHLEQQKESNEDYRPQEMSKLDKAVIRRRGNTVLFLVADDYEAAEKALG